MRARRHHAVQNKAVTGSWDHASRNGQPVSVRRAGGAHLPIESRAHRPLTREQALDYKMQLSFHTGPETMTSYLERLEYRVRYYRFFFLAPLYLALVSSGNHPRVPIRLVVLTLLLSAWASISSRHSSFITSPRSRVCSFW